MFKLELLAVVLTAALPLVSAAASQAYTWKNVKIGGGGGFVPGIVFNTKQKGLAFARTDIGGAYRLNSDDTWTPLLDFADNERWNYWGADALATDPVDPTRLYIAAGMYTNSWDPKNGNILISTDTGKTFTPSPLPFKLGGNMPGRGMGERLAIDPNNNSILFFGARSGQGLWKSTDYGKTWAKVSSFTNTGTYIPDPSDSSGLNSDKIGIAWVTFDSTSGSSGKATPRIFVGVANKGSNSVFVTNDGGSTWSAVAGQITTFLPHKGVLSPSEKTLYVSYSDGAGPYDGTTGAVYKYSIANSTWTNITPASGDDLYFGFGGVALDLQKPGTIMVAALNSWYPDGQIFRSTDSGASWSPLWTWGNYPQVNKFYSYSASLAPWLGPNYPITEAGVLQIGWMMEALVIDPFDSNHMLYGTGATVYGSRDLLKWDSIHNITLKSMADGIEETAILGLISPPSGPSLLSAVGDITGFVHNDLNKAPSTSFPSVEWPTTADLDFAGNKPAMIVGIGTGDTSDTGKNVVVSSNSGATWSVLSSAPDNVSNGKVALSADGTTILWSTGGNGVLVSQNNAAFTTVSSLGANAAIASDKKNNSVFYGALTNKFYVSTDGGKTFAAKGTLGSSNSPFKIVVHPSVSGDVWVSTDTGLFHSTNSGSTFTAIAGVSQAWAIGLGAPAKSGGYPAVFAAANIDSGVGYFRSDDAGVNWVKINDAAHGFGSAGANVLTADPRIYGRVYIGTNGRGIFYGDASGANPPPSTTAATTAATTATSQPPVTTTGTTTATSQPPTTTGTQSAWGQCGGIGWTGPTACVSGYSCVVSNPYYSQCVPA